MNTINLSGAAMPGNLPSRNHPLECFLRPFEVGKVRYLDAQVMPKTAIESGDSVFYRAVNNLYEILKVEKVVERRPANGDWTGIDVHMEWVRMIVK